MRYLKTLVLLAIAWGGAMFGYMTGELAGILGVEYGDSLKLFLVLIPASILVGLFGAAILYYFDRRRLASEIDIHADQLRPTESFVLELPMIQARAALLEALASLHRPKIVEDDTNTLTATTGVSWRTLGEVVTVKLQPNGEGRTLVQISSNPRVRATVVDYGANSDNLAIVKDALAKQEEDGDEHLT